MTLDSLFSDIDGKVGKTILKKLLSRFIDPAFGALSKSEVELIILEALEEVGAISSEPQVYELVTKLRVTRTKARHLIYERELRRSKPEDLDERVRLLLRKPLIDKAGKHFILEVENPLVSDHLRAKVQEFGHISDGSFSSGIIRLSVSAFVALVEGCLGDESIKAKQVLVDKGARE